MSLDLLKERFGSYAKKVEETDNKEKINETLNIKFNSNPMEDIKSFKDQHQEELKEKDEIIENLMQELGKQRLENKLALNTKKIYEDKIEKISILDFSTELISMLTEESRKKQGNQILDWSNWLKIPENKYLLQINEDVAKKVFQNTNDLIKRYISNINDTYRSELIEAGRTSRTRGGDAPATAVDTDYVLTFTGDTADGAREDYVSTLFNPDSYDGAGTGLNRGFTVSYWVKPLELTHDTYFAFGKRSQTHGAFQFGVKNANKIKVGIGSADKDDNTHLDGIGWEAGDDNVAHGAEVGKWSHWVVTYGGDDHATIGGDRQVRVWIDGVEILKNGASGGGMGTANWTPGWQNCDEGCDDAVNAASYIYFGGRSAFQGLDEEPPTPYNQGWACSLSEVAIYNVEKDEDGTFANEVYSAGWGYNHSGNSGLVGYWKFNEGSGTTVTDYGPYEKHGTLTTDVTELPTWEKNGSYE